MNATDTTVFSYSIVIRDMLLAKLQAAPFFAGFTFRKSRQLPSQPQDYPFLGVYIISEEMESDGDPNHGDIEFVNHLKIGFSVAVVNNDPEACEEKIDQAYWTICNTLWRDQYLMNLIDTRAYPGGVGNPDNTRIEGIERGSRRHVFGHAGMNNETPVGELRYEATLKYRTDFTPIITDDLLLIHEEVVMLDEDGTIPSASEVQRVNVVYEFDPSATTQELGHDRRQGDQERDQEGKSTDRNQGSPVGETEGDRRPTEDGQGVRGK